MRHLRLITDQMHWTERLERMAETADQYGVSEEGARQIAELLYGVNQATYDPDGVLMIEVDTDHGGDAA